MLPSILEKIKEKIPNIALTIAGSGDDEQSLRQEIAKRRLEKHVRFLGRFSPHKAASLLKDTAILIDPIDNSLTQRAKSSYRVALAGSHGVAAVSSNIGIRPLLLPLHLHERFFATANDPASYAEKIISLIRRPLTPEDQTCMREHAKCYLWETLAPAYEEFIFTL
jgi:glycosyltransferase involved in cell wall biosynthesis